MTYFFFLKWPIFCVDFDGGSHFLRKSRKIPYFWQKCQKIMIFWKSIFWIFGQIRAFCLIFVKNGYHHQILRKKWAILKKKSRSFRPFLTDFQSIQTFSSMVMWPWFFDFMGKNMGFYRFFAKNEYHHQILRKKWAIF